MSIFSSPGGISFMTGFSRSFSKYNWSAYSFPSNCLLALRISTGSLLLLYSDLWLRFGLFCFPRWSSVILVIQNSIYLRINRFDSTWLSMVAGLPVVATFMMLLVVSGFMLPFLMTTFGFMLSLLFLMMDNFNVAIFVSMFVRLFLVFLFRTICNTHSSIVGLVVVFRSFVGTFLPFEHTTRSGKLSCAW